MLRLLVALCALGVLVLVACGGDDTHDNSGSADPAADGEHNPAASVAAPAEAADPAATTTATAPGGGLAAEAQSCLELVRAGRWAEAVPPCTAAVQQSPDSEELRDALARAQQGAGETASAALQGAEDAAGATLDAAQADAAGRAGDALDGAASAVDAAAGDADAAAQGARRGLAAPRP